ncbi:MAG: DUF2059 domain-containing protein [Sneathiellales bacterium]|nr:DUF2059 domain-containing protein [Sneathiellales bacterium]
MNKILIPLVFLVLLPITAYSEELTDAKKALINELLQITNAKATAKGVMEKSVAPVFESIRKNPKFQKPGLMEELSHNVNAYLNREVIESSLMNDVAYIVYHRHFTLAELQEVIKFYRTPIGAKLATKTPIVAQESLVETQMRTRSLQAGVIKIMQETIAKYQQ